MPLDLPNIVQMQQPEQAPPPDIARTMLAAQQIKQGALSQQHEADLPGAIQSYQGGDKGALAQIYADNPEVANSIQNLDLRKQEVGQEGAYQTGQLGLEGQRVKQEGALQTSQIAGQQQEQQQRGMQMNLQKIQMQGLAAQNAYSTVSDMRKAGADPSQIQQVVKTLHDQYGDVSGEKAHPELADYNKDPDMWMQNMQTIVKHGQMASMMLNPPEASPGYMMQNGREVPIPGAPPKYEKMGDTMYAETPGQEPKPIAVTGQTQIDPATGQVIPAGPAVSPDGSKPTDTFGFKLPPTTPAAIKLQMKNDAAQQKSETANRAVIDQMEPTLEELRQNNDLYKTGKGKEAMAHIGQVVNSWTGLNEDSATASNNLEKGANDFLAQAMKLQPVGSRVTNAQLAIQQAGKPGLGNQHETNVNILNAWQGRIEEIKNTNDLFQQYREESPMHVTDSNTQKLDDALHTIYPSVTVKGGKTSLNKENIDAYKQAIPDAIANPDKYFEMAKKAEKGEAPAAAAAQKSPAASTGTGVLHVDKNGNKAMVFPDGHYEEVK